MAGQLKVFVAGFHHETNTFAPSPADWTAFEAGGGYPAWSRGEAMLAKHEQAALSIGGFVQAARARGWALVPSTWAGAMPSNRVTRDAFERIAGEITADLARGGFDAVYLDLHGAAVAEGFDDAEGELLERVRGVVGPTMPVVASLDLHANVTERMLGGASAMTAFRTYPHVDMRATGARAAAQLAARLGGDTFHSHARRIPFLLPLNAQCTLMEPAASVIERLERLEAEHGVELSFAMGFAAADFAGCGPVVFGHGRDVQAVRQAVDALHDEIVARRREWVLELLDADAAVERALTLARPGTGPVVIADTQDNPGAGGDANTTGLLHALLRAGAGRRAGGTVAIGLIHDPAASRAAVAAGVGAWLELSIGRAVSTFTGQTSEPPVTGRFRVTATSHGRVPLHGPMTAGMTMTLGACAAVEADGVQVLLSTGKAQMLDLDLFRFLGVEPASAALLVVKSSVHFRAAFAPIASHILVARAPGPMAADPGELPWRHLDPRVDPRP